jgi:hypothetical protein
MKTVDRIYLCLALVCIVLLFSGCAMTVYKEPHGTLFVRFTLGTDQIVGPVKMKSKDSQVELGGVQTSQSEAAGTMTSAAVKALKPTLIP